MHRMLMVVVALAALAVVVSSAFATAPAKNGRIAFKRYLDAAHETGGAIFTINPNGSGERQVTHPDRGTVDDQPDWAPDGTRILFQRCPSDSVCRAASVRPDGSDLHYLTPGCPAGHGPPDCTEAWDPAYSPDGHKIALGIASGRVKVVPGGDQIEKFTLVVMKADGSGQQPVFQLDDYKGDLKAPQFSPDGRRLVFDQKNSRFGVPNNGRAVFVINVDGTGLRRITPWQLDAGGNPDWSPNGKLLLFCSNGDVKTKQSQVYVARADGTGLKQITHFKRGTTVLSYSFSPDGHWITFAKSGVNGEPDVFVMRANGTHIRPVTRTKLWDSAPDWGPRLAR